ncbi:MAG: 2-oxoacid:acceptor oxidoreductase family protein [Acidobacteriota bacterium]
MIEIVIFGRGGQGGVTLAKLIAMTYFLQDQYAQAFGVYAAERSGAPVRAFVRIDSKEIICRNQIYEPDHVIVLERTLIDERITTGLKPGGWIVLNSSHTPEALAHLFPGYRIACVDANTVAIENNLGTRTTPIVNTTMLGAAARVFGEDFSAVEGALAELRFLGPNLSAARRAYDSVLSLPEPVGVSSPQPPIQMPRPTLSILDPASGTLPTIKTGTWATQQPRQKKPAPPCSGGCPAGNDVRGFVAAVRDRDLARALALLHTTSPFPGVCGRVCPAPCMEACHRSQFDQAVNIRELERYVADHAVPPPVEVKSFRDRVAVIGSGPAGLSAAYHLVRLGYAAHVIESQPALGGVMRNGIPPYRLPADVLDREIDYILRHGVTAATSTRVSKEDIVRLSRQFAAVFIATGLQESRNLNPEDFDSSVAMQGIDFLDAFRSGERRLDRQQVVVIGGGNTAIDAARTARRLGAQVRIVYRRTRAEMPAIREEIEEALEEGVCLTELLAPLSLKAGKLVCQRMVLGETDASGRRRPVPVAGKQGTTVLPCDRLILATGQSADLSIFPEGTEVKENGQLLGPAGAPIIAGGDLQTNEGTVAGAIGSGRKAAWHIHRLLTGENLFPAGQVETVGLESIRFSAFKRAPRHDARLRNASERLHDFKEVRLGLEERPGDAEAVEESRRCFSCGSCTQCDICRANCPEAVLTRRGDEYAFNYDYCKGCGLCQFECPRGVILMEQL